MDKFDFGQENFSSANVQFFYGRISEQLTRHSAEIDRMQERQDRLLECVAKISDITDVRNCVEEARTMSLELKEDLAKLDSRVSAVAARSGTIISIIVVLLLELAKYLIFGK